MGPAAFVTVFVLFAAAAGVAAWFAHKAEKERQAALRALATELGLDFDPSPDSDHDDEYAQFEIFRRGHSRIARNTLRGQLELFGRACDVCAGDFRYKVTSSNGKRTTTHTYDFSYLIVHPPWHTPALLVRPEGMFDKIASAFGFDDIDFESAEFSRKYFVKSTDKRFAYDVLHPRMIEFLLRSGPLMLDIENGALCVGDGAKKWPAATFRAVVAFVQQFCELWPRHLVKDLEDSKSRWRS